MKLAIMQPYFMPYLGYWQLLNAVDKYIILDNVSFIKQGYINRNYILSQGNSLQINIQVNGISSSKLILQHELNSNFKWKKKLLSTIKQNYAKAKYFNEAYEIIEECILIEENNLSKYLSNQIRKIANFLEIDTEIIENSSFEDSNLKGEERVLSICNREKASVYVNAIGGQSLYNKDTFIENNLELKFLKMNDIKYTQLSNEFIPSLSIIDVIMFNGKDKTKEMLNKFILV